MLSLSLSQHWSHKGEKWMHSICGLLQCRKWRRVNNPPFCFLSQHMLSLAHIFVKKREKKWTRHIPKEIFNIPLPSQSNIQTQYYSSFLNTELRLRELYEADQGFRCHFSCSPFANLASIYLPKKKLVFHMCRKAMHACTYMSLY